MDRTFLHITRYPNAPGKIVIASPPTKTAELRSEKVTQSRTLAAIIFVVFRQ